MDRYSYTSNNPINFIDPSEHYKCSLGYEAVVNGYTESDCINYVENALSVLEDTTHGQKVVEVFREHDSTDEVTIHFGFAFVVPSRTGGGRVSYTEINKLLGSGGRAIGNHIFMKTDSLELEPPSNEYLVRLITFEHEIVHVLQGSPGWIFGTLQAESEAYLIGALTAKELPNMGYDIGFSDLSPIYGDVYTTVVDNRTYPYSDAVFDLIRDPEDKESIYRYSWQFPYLRRTDHSSVIDLDLSYHRYPEIME